MLGQNTLFCEYNNNIKYSVSTDCLLLLIVKKFDDGFRGFETVSFGHQNDIFLKIAKSLICVYIWFWNNPFAADRARPLAVPPLEPS